MDVRIEFWNGHKNKSKKNAQYHGHVKTRHNPCLWSNSNVDTHPWRLVYKEALIVLDKWQHKEFDDTEFLHHLRYVAYGLGKRSFDDTEVIWPGNLTPQHEPMVCISIGNEAYTIKFNFVDNAWTTKVVPTAEFVWDL